MKKIPLPTILTAGLLVFILVSYAVTYQVRFSETAVRVRLGRADASSVDADPGIKPRWPWPIEHVTNYDRRLSVLDTPDAETKTRDDQNLVVGFFAVWQIADPLRYYKVVRNEARAEELLRARINQARQDVVGNVDLSAFVSLDPSQVAYDRIEARMLEACGPGVLNDYGIQLRSIGVRRISLPERATQAVFESMSSQRQSIAARLREEGAAAAQKIEAQAKAHADQIMAFAQRRAEAISSEGYRVSARIFEQIEQQDRELYLFLKSLDALKAIFQQNTTFFLDTKTELFRRFSERPAQAPAEAPAPAPGAGS